MRPNWVTAALATARVARLGTTGDDRRIRLVPICFAIVDDHLVSAVDHKPKRTARLARLDDITATGSATVLVDHYDEDWNELWWVRIRGAAAVRDEDDGISVAGRVALGEKYRQYRDRPPRGPVYSIRLDEVTWWRASSAR
jgi:PPOX class probable F420-dependent enzyme